jgi:hypothetical protein
MNQKQPVSSTRCSHEDVYCDNERLHYVNWAEEVCIEYDIVCNICKKTIGVERHVYRCKPTIEMLENSDPRR